MFYVYIYLFNKLVNDIPYVSLQKHPALMNDSSITQTFKTPEQPVLLVDADEAFTTLTHPRGGGSRAAVPTNPPSEVKFKEHKFCRRNDIKSFTRFTLQPKSTTEIGR
jgi:hypothetical protein